ncbi:hypothetical protein EVAR_93585_1 [Eumeta japonica]|uniref:Uncharacterized protein n=1 Tax=Eumeta variegata TaxID=151549 RepID=A0A4C1SAG1_EUMVA|nr:hypothetical protein EVAR_93585_1 [Eumeta japonica]
MCFRSAANDPVAVATNPQSKPAKRLDLDPLYRGDLKKHTFLYVTADGNQTALFGCDTISPNHNNEKTSKHVDDLPVVILSRAASRSCSSHFLRPPRAALNRRPIWNTKRL